MEKKKALFIDRDGTLIVEPPDTFQVDSLDKLEFMPGVFRNLYEISKKTDYELVIVSNQDGLGTSGYPEETFRLVQSVMLKAFENEGVEFDNILIDPTREEENKPTRKPGTGMLTGYMRDDYDLSSSYVIGDRITDIELASNLGAKGILIGDPARMRELERKGLSDDCALIAGHWDMISSFLINPDRKASYRRKTGETEIYVEVETDGDGRADISTGLNFFDHMLEQVARHSGCNLIIKAEGDLHRDEHHTIEDTAITLGAALRKALGSKRGIERYGFVLPMDDSLCLTAIDFGGRTSLLWEASFKREMIGDMPTEMISHFFRSFSEEARCNLYIHAKGENEHHKCEAIFKSFARAIMMAVRKEPLSGDLPTTKGYL